MKRLYGDMESSTIYREMRSVNGHSGGPSVPIEGEEQQQAINNPLEKLGPFASLEYNIRWVILVRLGCLSKTLLKNGAIINS